MKLHTKLFSVVTIIISFGLFQALSPSLNAQNMYKISADRPSGEPTSQSDDNSSNETLYIVAGVAVAAIVGYVIYKRFNKKEDDSTSTTESSTYRLLENERNTFVNQMNEVKEKMPVDLFFAVKNQSVTIPDRTYSVGLSFKF